MVAVPSVSNAATAQRRADAAARALASAEATLTAAIAAAQQIGVATETDAFQVQANGAAVLAVTRDGVSLYGAPEPDDGIALDIGQGGVRLPNNGRLQARYATIPGTADLARLDTTDWLHLGESVAGATIWTDFGHRKAAEFSAAQLTLSGGIAANGAVGVYGAPDTTEGVALDLGQGHLRLSPASSLLGRYSAGGPPGSAELVRLDSSHILHVGGTAGATTLWADFGHLRALQLTSTGATLATGLTTNGAVGILGVAETSYGAGLHVHGHILLNNKGALYWRYPKADGFQGEMLRFDDVGVLNVGYDAGTVALMVAGAQRGAWNQTGLRIGTGLPNYPLDVLATLNTPIALFSNQYNTAPSSFGITIQAGGASGTTTLIAFLRQNDGATIGSITHNGSVTAYNTTSDRALKTRPVPTPLGMDTLRAIPPVAYGWRAAPTVRHAAGWIAQDVAAVFPEAVTAPTAPEGYWQLDYGRMSGLVAAALLDYARQTDARLARLEA